MSSIGKTLLSGLAFVHILVAGRNAYAEDPAAAEVLFQEGRRLLAAGQIASACEKLRESYALDAMSGTLLNLAACYEQDGKTATAWARFRNAANLAKSQGKLEQMAEANRRAKALEGELSYLTIVVVEPVPGLEVKRNDFEVTPATFGVEVPIDPGHVEVVASAPGYQTARLNVDVGARRDKQTITIPKLAKSEKAASSAAPGAAGASAARPSAASSASASQSSTRTDQPQATTTPSPGPSAESTGAGPGITPWIIGGIGVAALATGGVFGALAMKSDKDANALCPSRIRCPANALDAAEARDQQAWIANVGVGVGLVGITTAAVWLVFGGSKAREQTGTRFVVRPSISKDAAALWAQGRF